MLTSPIFSLFSPFIFFIHFSLFYKALLNLSHYCCTVSEAAVHIHYTGKILICLNASVCNWDHNASHALLASLMLCNTWLLNPFTPESDQCQNSPAASQEIWLHTVWRTWLFIAYSDEKWLYYKFSLHHSYNRFLKGWENILFELRSERDSGVFCTSSSIQESLLFIVSWNGILAILPHIFGCQCAAIIIC